MQTLTLTTTEAMNEISNHMNEAWSKHGCHTTAVSMEIVTLAGAKSMANLMTVASLIAAAGGVRAHQAKFSFRMNILADRAAWVPKKTWKKVGA